jgi:hypothetical protein
MRALTWTALIALALLGGAGRAAPIETHAVERRVAHIRSTLQAVQEARGDALTQATEYARVLVRGACSSGVERLKVECLMTAARRYCKGRGAADAARCPLYMDEVLSTVLADEQLIPVERRYQIMRDHKDYRRALAEEARRLRGALAVDFRLRTGEATDDATLALNIDHYCLTTSDESNLAVPTCVSSLIWFIRVDGAKP